CQGLLESSGTVAVAPASARRPLSLIRGRLKATDYLPTFEIIPATWARAKAIAGIRRRGWSPQNQIRGAAAIETHTPVHHGQVINLATNAPSVRGRSSSQSMALSRKSSVIVSRATRPVTRATARA